MSFAFFDRGKMFSPFARSDRFTPNDDRMLAEGCELELLEEEADGREVGEAELREALMEELADLLPPAR